MKSVYKIGKVKWDKNDLRKSLKQFEVLFKKRPWKNNTGGMQASHMFASWFVMKKLQPAYVIESGVWRGQTTWLIEKTLPDAKIISLDPNLKKNRYVSKNSIYLRKDFDFINWKNVPREKTLIIIDDHQNALERIKKAMEFGFIHLVFDDNCAPIFVKGSGFGDFYSCKKIFCEAGHFPDYTFLLKIKKILWTIKYTKSIRLLRKCFQDFKSIPANIKDKDYLKKIIDIYYEFPPIFNPYYSNEKMRNCFRQDSLLGNKDMKTFKEFYNYKEGYFGICYIKLKDDFGSE